MQNRDPSMGKNYAKFGPFCDILMGKINAKSWPEYGKELCEILTFLRHFDGTD